MYVDYAYQCENQDEEILLDLMRTNRFNQADLAENRLGKMSTNQMIRLTIKAVVPIILLGLPLAGLIVMCVFAAEIFPYVMTKVRLMLAMGKYLVAFGGAIVFGLIALVINFILHSERFVMFLSDLAAGQAGSDNGRLHTSMGEEIQDGIDQILRRKTVVHSYVLKGQSYRVSEAGYDALRDHSGSMFRIYFTPKSRFILSIEPSRTASAS